MVIRFRPDMSNYPKALAGYQMKTNRNVFIQSNNFFGVGPMMPQPPKIGFWGGFGVSLGTALNYLLNRGGLGGISAGSTIAQGGQGDGGNIDKDIESLNNLYGNKYKFGNVGGKVSITDKDGNQLTHGLTVSEAEDYVKNHQNDVGDAGAGAGAGAGTGAGTGVDAGAGAGAGAGKTAEQLAVEHKPKLVKDGNDWVEKNDHSKKYEFKDGAFNLVTNQESRPSAANTATVAIAPERNGATGVLTNGNIPNPPQLVINNAAKAEQIKKGADIQVTDYGENGGYKITGAKLNYVDNTESKSGGFPKSFSLVRDGKTISYNFVQVKDGVAVYKSVNGSQMYFLQNKEGKLELMQPAGKEYLSMGASSPDNPRWQ